MSATSLPRRRLLQGGSAWALLAGSAWRQSATAATFADLPTLQKTWWPQSDAVAAPLALPEAGRWAEPLRQQGLSLPKVFQPRLWRMQAGAATAGPLLGWLAADRVIGKYDWIDFAVGFAADGAVLDMDILAYRESHGAEVRQAQWRAQFKGRKGPQALRFADDIRNVSGATLSCQHLSEGVQRLSALVMALASAH